MGDEVRRTQRGNNNAYCQDNEINWFDSSFLTKTCGCPSVCDFTQRYDVVCEVQGPDSQRVSLESVFSVRGEPRGMARCKTKPAGLGGEFT